MHVRPAAPTISFSDGVQAGWVCCPNCARAASTQALGLLQIAKEFASRCLGVPRQERTFSWSRRVSPRSFQHVLHESQRGRNKGSSRTPSLEHECAPTPQSKSSQELVSSSPRLVTTPSHYRKQSADIPRIRKVDTSRQLSDNRPCRAVRLPPRSNGSHRLCYLEGLSPRQLHRRCRLRRTDHRLQYIDADLGLTT